MDHIHRQDYDPDQHFDSSSSSGDGSSPENHSSPAYSAHSEQAWAMDLGLNIPWSPSQAHTSALDPIGLTGVKFAPREARQSRTREGTREPSASLTSDFWKGGGSGMETLSPSALSGTAVGGEYFGNQVKKGEDVNRPMEFDDRLHQGFCSCVLPPSVRSPSPSCSFSPSTLNRHPAHSSTSAALPPPIPSTSTSPATENVSMYSHLQPAQAFAPHSPEVSMPVDPSLLGSIAPALTSNTLNGISLPPIPPSLPSPAEEQPSSGNGCMGTRRSARTSAVGVGREDDTPLAPRSSSRNRASTSFSRDASLSRRSDASSSASSGAVLSSSTAATSVDSVSNSVTPAATYPPTYPPAPILPSHLQPLTTLSGKPTYTPSGSLNLVARDAVQAAEHIPNLVAPPPHTIIQGGQANGAGPLPLQLLVLGVPTVGAKSRVETQIKISLALVRPTSSGPPLSPYPSVGPEAGAYTMDDGALDPKAAAEVERVGSWGWVRLPKFMALKAKNNGRAGARGSANTAAAEAAGTANGEAKKARPEPPPESTLSLSVAVVCATSPHHQVTICPNCRQRELKRSLRKKDPRGGNKTIIAPPPPPPPQPRNEDEERRKVVVFNANEFVEFGTGECVLPTRITCYCRHHKEKKGFRVTYSLSDHLGNLVAYGETPPIMITDDHKTNLKTSAPTTTLPTPLSIPANGQASTSDPSPASGTKRKAPTLPKIIKEKKEKAPSPAASTRPRRANAGRGRRGQSASEEDGTEAVGAGPASKKARPYDAEARPSRKRTSAAQRSPTFSMEPIVTTQMPPPQALSPTGSVVAPPSAGGAGEDWCTPNTVVSPIGAFSSSLGLGGMDDAVMSSEDAYPPMTGSDEFGRPPTSMDFLPPHRTGSIDLAQGTFDFRSSMSTPPLSPGSTAPSIPDTFHSLFSGFPSPQPTLFEPQPSILEPAVASPQALSHPSQSLMLPQQPQQPYPSFAIPSTEALPTSLTPDWTLLQQQLQRSEPPAPPPRINRIIPGEGPVSGGIEVTVLGENFVRDLVCAFGDTPAVPTHFWSASTLVCVLPPSANPGPVVVGIKGVPLQVDQGGGLQLFTYKDDSDRSLLELALQVVGLQMTGKMESASAIAMRIVGNGPGGAGGANVGGIGGTGGAGGAPIDTASLAATLNSAASSVYATPAASRASSRRASVDGSSSPPAPAHLALTGETRNFQDIVIKFLSLLDLDPSLIPGSAPSLPSTSPPISQPNTQQHTLLHLATVLGFHRLVAFLLARGIALDAADRNGYTALHFAALYGRVAIARLLLDAGARVGIQNLAGRTPLDIAQERDDVDVEELLLARGTAVVTPTLPVGRNELLAPPRTASVVDLEDEDEDEPSSEEGTGFSGEDYESDWTVSASASEVGEAEDWESQSSSDEDEDEEELSAGESGEEADESTVETPVRARRSRTLSSRDASTVSLQGLLHAEEEAKSEKRRPSPRSRKVPLPDDIPSATPITPLNHLASASSKWISQKLKPSVQPSLDKLQPFAGGMTNAWEKAKANRFAFPQMQLPQMHIPEITAFHAMPAALTRRPRPASSLDDTDGEGAESASERPSISSLSREWRASFAAGHWWHKTPSSPPPQYTPTDSLVANPRQKEDQTEAVALVSPFSSPASSPSLSITSSRASPVLSSRVRMRRRTSAASYTSEDTDSEAFNAEQGKLVGFSGDRMLLLFWLPVLLFVLAFAYANWAQYAQPVVDTLAETILPSSIGRLLT
ncbi:hypothetical protein JCM11641_006371 [Rhodosporidiobolus odoratus]